MKTNPIIIVKHDNIKKRSGPTDLKRKMGSLPTQLTNQSNLNKLQIKPRSTSKSQQKPISLNFSKSFLISDRLKNKDTSSERLKSFSGKRRNQKISKDSPSHLFKAYKQPQNDSKVSHYHSTDKEKSKTQLQSKSKSYLINYLNNRHHSEKAESLGKLQKLTKEELFKNDVKKVTNSLKFAFRTKQGVMANNPSKPNQDSYLIKQHPHDASYLFAVADGHGQQGHYVSQLIVNRMEKYYLEKGKQKNTQSLFTDSYNKIQHELFQTQDINAFTSGSTFISLLIQPNSKLTCANVGDSRAILARQIDKKNWEIIHLSEDHKPNIEKEKKRILKKGGKIHSYRDENGKLIGPQRVWLPNQNMQGLAMSRSMGDNISKPIGVTHQPQIVHLQLEERDKFIMVASDGVWEFIKNFQILQLVVPFYKEGKLEQCCDALLKLAYQRWTNEDDSVVDDITFILIFLNIP